MSRSIGTGARDRSIPFLLIPNLATRDIRNIVNIFPMLIQTAFQREFHLTVGARERFLARVHSNMASQVIERNARFSTSLAFKLPVGVSSHMGPEIIVFVFFVTNGAADFPVSAYFWYLGGQSSRFWGLQEKSNNILD